MDLLFAAPEIRGAQFAGQGQRIAFLALQGVGLGIVVFAAFGPIAAVIVVSVCVVPWIAFWKWSQRVKVLANDQGVRVVNVWQSYVLPWASLARFELGRTWHDRTDAGYAVFSSGGRLRLDALIVTTRGTDAEVERRRALVASAVAQLQGALQERYPARTVIGESQPTDEAYSEWPDESVIGRWRRIRAETRRESASTDVHRP